MNYLKRSFGEIRERYKERTEKMDGRLNFSLMKKRQQTIPRKGRKKRMVNRNIRYKCKQAKDEWLNSKCAEGEKKGTSKQHALIKA